ncbi:ROK family transcriptional regulator [Streptomyces sp. MBT57]|nr:ROK family transcriptional regulator [Streptomyces sp. MBT57]
MTARPANAHQARLLRLLRDGGPNSRAQLGDQVDLSRSKLAVEVDRLLETGLVVADGLAASRGGRRSHNIRLAPELRFLGVDIGATSIDVAVTNAELEVLGHLNQPMDVREGPVAVFEQVLAMAAKLRASGLAEGFDGARIGVPGPVRFPEGVPVAPPIMPGWDGFPVREALSQDLGCPVMVDNDANTAAWAEWRFGAGRGEDHLVMITLGTGIGGAILEDGQVKRGKYGVAGEFGHMQVVPSGHRCPCGNRGCWEQYSSGNALVREARELAAADSPVAHYLLDRVKGNIPDITGPLITELAREGDAMCIELLQDIGQWLGVGIANLAAALDPSCFVIGGGVSAADDLLIGPARDAFKRHLTGRGYRPEAKIAKAQLGPEAGMVGAADLARLVARRFRRANRRRVERYERYAQIYDQAASTIRNTRSTRTVD